MSTSLEVLTNLTWRSLPAVSLLEDDVLRSAWDRLNDARGGVPVLMALVVGTAVELLGSGDERLLVASSATGPAAMFIVAATGRQGWQTFQPSQLPLGAWVATSELSVDALAYGLLHHAPRLTLMASLTQLDPRIATRADKRSNLLTLDYIETAWVDLDGDFEHYWAMRGKNLRQNLKKQRNRLAAAGIETRLERIIDSDQMAAAVARYGVLESSSWKAKMGTAIGPDNTQGRFYATLMSRLASHRQAQIYEYRFNDQLVASDLVIQRGTTTVILKTTYDESVSASSPAMLLLEDALKHWFVTGEVRRLEFYGRLRDWHTRFTANKVQLYHATIYRWPWLKLLSERLGERRRAAAMAVDSQAVPNNTEA